MYYAEIWISAAVEKYSCTELWSVPISSSMDRHWVTDGPSETRRKTKSTSDAELT